MSVVPHWKFMKPWQIPTRLRQFVASARGSDKLVIWRHGDGCFETSPINDKLLLGSVTATHGQVEPAQLMSISDFQDALAATQSDWVRDEEP
jgi:hypothetical protein